MMTQKTNRKGTFYVLAVLLFCIIAVLALEITLRVMGEEPFREVSLELDVDTDEPFFKPDSLLGYAMNAGEFNFTYPGGQQFTATNLADGYRTAWSNGRIRPDTVQTDLYVLGCSYTYGWAVDDSATFCDKLQNRLPLMEVHNYGVSGYGNVQGLLQLQAILAQDLYPAPMIIMTYAPFHDGRNVLSRYWLWKNASFSNITGPLQVPAAVWENGELTISYHSLEFDRLPLEEYSALVFWLDKKCMNRQNSDLWKTQLSEHILLEAANLCKEHQVPFAVALLDDDERSVAVKSFLDAHGVATMYVGPNWEQPGVTNLPFDNHPSPAGHDTIATNMLKLVWQLAR